MRRRPSLSVWQIIALALGAVAALAVSLHEYQLTVYGRGPEFGIAKRWHDYEFAAFIARIDAMAERGTTYADLPPQDRRLVIAAPVDALDWAEKNSADPLLPIYLYTAADVYRRLVPRDAQGNQGRLALMYIVEHFPNTIWATFAKLDLEAETR